MPTPHIAAEPGDLAELVLLPGDPLRARWIAERHLDDARLVSAVRNVLGYTGTYRGVPVSVLGTGMGVPSISIYATELAVHFGCRRLVRVGSCGAIVDDLALHDLVAAIGAGTDSGVNRARLGGYDLAAVADFGLLRAVVVQAVASGVGLRVGSVFTSDLFYRPDDDLYRRLAAHGMVAVEMEAAGLYGVAAATGVAALVLCTVSDHLGRDEHLTAEERERGFGTMVGLALDALGRT
jgi:purine-nucleoside phosphorylase